jgi:hypothetical protein
MPLPKIKHPIFETTLPISGNKIKFRPFTVKEEKLLLVAQEANDEDQMVLALKQVINNCVVEGDTKDISIIDFEYIFIQLRAKSVNNIADIAIIDPDTGETVELAIPLDNVKTRDDPKHSRKIEVSDTMVIMMQYPTVDQYINMLKGMMDKGDQFELMLACMESVIEEDEIHKLAEYSRDEIVDFVDDFDEETTKKIGQFFETMPSLYYEAKYKDNQGEDKTFVIEGLKSFFH